MVNISERSLEETIERVLLENGPDARPKASHDLARERQPEYGEPSPSAPGGYRLRRPDEYDRELSLIPRDLIDFVQATQPKTWTRLQEHLPLRHETDSSNG